MASNYQDNRKKLAERLKTEPAKVPVQEVRPVEPTRQAKKEAHVNFWIPEELMEQVKLYAVKSKKSIKQIGIEAFENYLKNTI